jgi:hypothetical protein
MRQSLLNTPTPPFEGAATALYTKRGPAGPAPNYNGRRKGEPPQSITDHIADAVAKIPDLSARQRNAVKAAVTSMLHDIRFLQMLHAQTRDPWIKQDEGRPL